MMRRRLVAIIVALASLFSAHGAVARPALASVDVGSAEIQLLDLLNQERIAGGLQPLRADTRLMEVARWRSEDMVARNFFGHDLGGFTIASILRERQVPFRLAGENIVSNTFDDQSTVALAHAELMKSPTHRENILRSDYNQVGIGVAVGADRKTVFTQIFVQAAPPPQPTATPQTVPTVQPTPTTQPIAPQLAQPTPATTTGAAGPTGPAAPIGPGSQPLLAQTPVAGAPSAPQLDTASGPITLPLASIQPTPQVPPIAQAAPNSLPLQSA